ncbi:bifunctional 2-polyprenyl-6-hydroxyphenol methylase/3-demethylubiquinol 3-O-methyltransferase UbiG [Moritella sp. Urea-trap-13]|uniref:class I SAM-dependent methyltransferase n=1 Tax=Moritella sp. Urea-trap-13 TaxID=2058327 RepID=UPI000C325CB7|nr:class I SAM-dependent methyltransferase [Moritella sp. Urea-trap-13]PKH07036.1 SAM-dependent methyltransferase [Moritella sp. Urea-trap-13]
MVNNTNSISFYNNNADEFIRSTIAVDMISLYQKFLPLLPVNAHILDAGCGSGRDSKHFINNGFSVTAMDASKALAESAAALIGQPVHECLFQDFQIEKQFDAIWACASLLHVPSADLPAVFTHLASQLKPQGVFYCSFKYGNDDVERGGRYFTNANETRLNTFIADTNLTVKDNWLTGDLRPGRESECWINVILQKNS